jgi:hypothetical protein
MSSGAPLGALPLLLVVLLVLLLLLLLRPLWTFPPAACPSLWRGCCWSLL